MKRIHTKWKLKSTGVFVLETAKLHDLFIRHCRDGEMLEISPDWSIRIGDTSATFTKISLGQHAGVESTEYS